VPAAVGRDVPIKRADRHAIIHYIMHQQAPWDNAASGSYLITQVKQDLAWLVPGWESVLGFISMSSLLFKPSVSTLCVPNGTHQFQWFHIFLRFFFRSDVGVEKEYESSETSSPGDKSSVPLLKAHRNQDVHKTIAAAAAKMESTPSSYLNNPTTPPSSTVSTTSSFGPFVAAHMFTNPQYASAKGGVVSEPTLPAVHHHSSTEATIALVQPGSQRGAAGERSEVGVGARPKTKMRTFRPNTPSPERDRPGEEMSPSKYLLCFP
jgi:hypothetical protein